MLYFYFKKAPGRQELDSSENLLPGVESGFLDLPGFILPHQTHLGAENALFLPKKTARLPKNLLRSLILPHQTHLGAENALFLHKKKNPILQAGSHDKPYSSVLN